ncbi:unnamed protein product, partial [Rotaria socialis]
MDLTMDLSIRKPEQRIKQQSQPYVLIPPAVQQRVMQQT